MKFWHQKSQTRFSYEILALKVTKQNITREKLLKSCQKDIRTKKARG